MIQVVLKNGKYAIYSNGTGGQVPPVNNVAPVISGTAVVGQVLTTTNGTWSNSPTSFSYQWKRGVTNIGTNSSTYTLVTADAGNTSNITCVVTATNAGGSANATSNQIAQILTVRTNSFLTASAISDATIRGGLNTFDIGLISNSLDTKMKAVYPFVGGTASTHRWNFMNTADTNAAFRLAFSGTWTHSSTGALPNGSNAFANTFLTPSTNLTLSNHSFGLYSRTEDVTGNKVYGAAVTAVPNFLQNNLAAGNFISGEVGTLLSYTASPTRAFLFASRTSTSLLKAYRNNTILGSNTATMSSFPTHPFYFGARNDGLVGNFYNSYEHAFGFIGDGLSDAESTNLYTLVQAFQTTLGRSVGPQVVSDPDAQAFVTAADIQDQIQADAVNNLVIGMKAQGLWTKMKAIYPMVGGTAAKHKFNLKNPLDTDAAFRLQFAGSWTHSALGASPNGSNTLARTYLVPTTALNTNDHALFFYLNTNNPNVATDPLDMGSIEDNNRRLILYSRLDLFGGTADAGAVQIPYVAPAACFALITKQSATVSSAFKNATKVATAASGGTPPPLYDIIFGNCRIQGTPYGAGWSNNRFAMVGISDGLSDADSVNLYNLTQSFQTTLGRQNP